jgi:methylmalonyl-CoA mutase N-terminal domain/subunit
VHNDFFEEIAKLRAARRIWARIMKERFHARNPRSLLCRIHCQTAGVSLAAQQPHNNVIRVTLQALAAVLGGAQSLHTNSMDETLALPTENSVRIALRTQQIIAFESGVANTIDPLGGSYFLESLTNELEAQCMEFFTRIDALGGMIPAIERGYPQHEIQEASYIFQQALERREKIIVGVNEFAVEEAAPIDVLLIDDEIARRQADRLRNLRAERDSDRVSKALSCLKRDAEGSDNLIPSILECVRAYATLGEMCDVLRLVFGEYREPGFDGR